MAGELGKEDTTSDQALQELMADNSSQMQPTKKRIRTSLTIFRTYLLEKNLKQSVEKTYSPEQLNTVLTNFYLEMKKPDGKNYAGTSLKSIRYGLQKHFLKLRNEDIVRDEKYSSCNETFKTLVKIMTEETEVQKQRNSIHPDDVAKLYNTAFSTDSPKGLQRKTIFEFIYYFCDRGREHLRRVCKEDFVFSQDSAGREYVTVKGRYSKRESREQADSESVRMYSRPGDPTCPVRSFKKYLRKLNPMNPCFWQRPKRTYYQSDAVWYENAPLGKNTLSALMFNLSEEAKLSKKYSNSSIRATDLTELEYQSELTRLDHQSNLTRLDHQSHSIRLDHQSNLTRLDHQSNLTRLGDQPETTNVISTVISDLSHQNSCADCDNKTRTPILNEYRNILIGEAAIAWKQLIGRFDFCHDSELASHLIEVHEVYCMSKGVCPLERTRDLQNSDLVCRTLGQTPTKRSGEREEMSLKLEVDEVDDSVDEDLSGDSDLDLPSEEEIEGKEEPYFLDNISLDPVSTQQAKSRVPHTHSESLDSGGHDSSHITTEVKQEPVESNSEAGSFTVTNNSLGTGEVIGNQTFQTKPASVSAAQTSLLTTLKHTVITKQTQNANTCTTQSHQGQRSPTFRFSSAQGVKKEDPPTGLLNLYTEQKGSTLYIKKGTTPNSILVCSKNSGSFQPATLNLLTKSETQSSSALERYRVLPNVGHPAPVSCQPVSTSSKLGRPARVSCRPVLTSSKLGQPAPVSCRPVSTSPKLGHPAPVSCQSVSTSSKLGQPARVSCQPVLTSPKVGHPVPVSCQPVLTSSKVGHPVPVSCRPALNSSPNTAFSVIKDGQEPSPASTVIFIKKGQQGTPEPSKKGQQGTPVPSVPSLKGYDTVQALSSLLREKPSPRSGVSLLQGQNTPVSQGQNTPVSQGQNTPVSGALQGQNTPLSQGKQTPVSGALQGQHTSVSGVLQGQHTSVSGVLQGQHTSVSDSSQGQHTSVSDSSQGQHTSVSDSSQGQHTSVSDSSQGQHTSVSGALQHTSVSGALQGQHTPALHGQITPMSCVSVLQGQTSPVKGFPAPSIPLSKGTQNGPHVPHFLLIKGGQHFPSPGVSMMTSGQHTSHVPGFLLIRGGKQTSHGSDLHGELQGEQKEKETNEMAAEDIGELEMAREENLSRETKSSGEEIGREENLSRETKSSGEEMGREENLSRETKSSGEEMGREENLSRETKSSGEEMGREENLSRETKSSGEEMAREENLSRETKSSGEEMGREENLSRETKSSGEEMAMEENLSRETKSSGEEMAREENLSRETKSSGEEMEESSKDWKSRRKRKSPTRIPSELATEDQAGRGASVGDSLGSDSEDKPIVKKSKRDEDL